MCTHCVYVCICVAMRACVLVYMHARVYAILSTYQVGTLSYKTSIKSTLQGNIETLQGVDRYLNFSQL